MGRFQHFFMGCVPFHTSTYSLTGLLPIKPWYYQTFFAHVGITGPLVRVDVIIREKAYYRFICLLKKVWLKIKTYKKFRLFKSRDWQSFLFVFAVHL